MRIRRHRGRILAIASAIMLIIASFLPWATINLLGVTRTVRGIQGDGKIQIGIACVTLFMLAIPKIKMWLPLVLSTISALVAKIDYDSISKANKEVNGLSEIRFGFYLVALSIIGLIAGCLWSLMLDRETRGGS